MPMLTTSTKAQNSLVKLLIKLGLLEAANGNSDYLNKEHCPIALFAELGKIDEVAALNKVSQELGTPVIQFSPQLAQQALECLESPPLKQIPATRWKEIRSVPLKLEDGRLLLAVANPLDRDSTGALEFQLGCPVDLALARESEILAIIGRQLNQFEERELVGIFAAETGGDLAFDSNSKKESTLNASDVAAEPVIRVVNTILSGAIENGASDIHLSPQRDELTVRTRVDGIMREFIKVPGAMQGAVTSRVKLLAGMDIAERRKPQDGRIRVKTSFGVRDLRVSSLPTAYGESVVIRVLSADFTHLNFEALRMPQQLEWAYQTAIRGSCKVILVTGPTGSGKTSTLYTSVLALNNGTNNIITVEDPIEYKIANINQVQVNHRIGMGFPESLRSILRQDPDIILIGEIRDADTANIAFQAAQTGHLVLSTLHTNTAAGAITRLRDLGTPAYLIAAALGGVLAQRLVRRLCQECARELTEREAAALAALGLPADKIAGARQAVGCKACGQSGYKGRQGIYSFLDVNDQVRAAIRMNESEAEIEKLACSTGFFSLSDSAKDLLYAGITTVDEIERCLGPITVLWGNSTTVEPDSEKAASETANQGLKKPRVLLVEDDENTRSIIGMVLENNFFEVDEAENGYQALECVANQRPDLVVCDLMMPKMGGLEFLRKVRADPKMRTLPVLIITAADSEANELDLISNGADDFVSKTTDTKVLLARIDRLLNH